MPAIVPFMLFTFPATVFAIAVVVAVLQRMHRIRVGKTLVAPPIEPARRLTHTPRPRRRRAVGVSVGAIASRQRRIANIAINR